MSRREAGALRGNDHDASMTDYKLERVTGGFRFKIAILLR